MTEDFESNLNAVSEDMRSMEDSLERDLESLLRISCTITLEEVDTETGEATLKAELDLAGLREKLKNVGGYEDTTIEINNGSLMFHIWPSEDKN